MTSMWRALTRKGACDGVNAGARPGARAALTVMVTWREFESEATDIAAVAVMLWPGITALNRRDPRCAIHALPGPDDDELAIRARVIEVGQDMAVRAAIIAVVQPSGVGGMIETVTDDPIFEFDIVRVDVARWLDIGQPGTRAVRQTWKAR